MDAELVKIMGSGVLARPPKVNNSAPLGCFFATAFAVEKLPTLGSLPARFGRHEGSVLSF